MLKYIFLTINCQLVTLAIMIISIISCIFGTYIPSKLFNPEISFPIELITPMLPLLCGISLLIIFINYSSFLPKTKK